MRQGKGLMGTVRGGPQVTSEVLVQVSYRRHQLGGRRGVLRRVCLGVKGPKGDHTAGHGGPRERARRSG